LTKPTTFRHNQTASVAPLRRLFAFGTPFGFPLESPFTFTGIPRHGGFLFCQAPNELGGHGKIGCGREVKNTYACIRCERTHSYRFIALSQQFVGEPAIHPEKEDMVDRIELEAIAHGRPW
jgi:hypothetical protein